MDELDRNRPIATRVGDAVLWSTADGEPLGVTDVIPQGPTSLLAALATATVPAGPCEAIEQATAFAASLGSATTVVPATVDLADLEVDLDEELATLSFLARLSA